MNFREQAERRMSYSMPVHKGQRMIALACDRSVRGTITLGEEFEALGDSQATHEGMMVPIRLSNGRAVIQRTSRFSFPQ